MNVTAIKQTDDVNDRALANASWHTRDAVERATDAVVALKAMNTDPALFEALECLTTALPYLNKANAILNPDNAA